MLHAVGGGGLCDTPGACGTLVSDILIEARVGLAAGRLTSAEWLRPTATRGGLRDAARWLEAALVPGCIYVGRMVWISFAPRSSAWVPLSADSPELPDGYNLLFLTSLFDFIPSTNYIITDIDLPKALWTYDNNPKALDLWLS